MEVVHESPATEAVPITFALSCFRTSSTGIVPTLVAYVPAHLPVTSTDGGDLAAGAEEAEPQPNRSKLPIATHHRDVVIAPFLPSFAETVARTFALGREERLQSLFATAGFCEMRMTREAHRFALPSFDQYFGPFALGGGSTGQAFLSLPEEVRVTVREEVRRSLGGTGGPVHIDVEFGFASACRK